MIEAFKISKGYDNIGSGIFFSKNASNLRGHSMKVTKKSFKLDVRKFSFSNRVINEWNGLSEEIIQSKSLAGFTFDNSVPCSRVHMQVCRSTPFLVLSTETMLPKK